MMSWAARAADGRPVAGPRPGRLSRCERHAPGSIDLAEPLSIDFHQPVADPDQCGNVVARSQARPAGGTHDSIQVAAGRSSSRAEGRRRHGGRGRRRHAGDRDGPERHHQDRRADHSVGPCRPGRPDQRWRHALGVRSAQRGGRHQRPQDRAGGARFQGRAAGSRKGDARPDQQR